MTETIIVAARTGGQGKTLVSQLIAFGLEIAAQPARIVAIDSTGDDSCSKLAKFLDQVEDVQIAPDLANQKRDPRSGLSHWDQIGERLMAGGALIDVGANVIWQLLDWAELRHAAEVLRRRGAPPITLVVPTRAQAQAVEDALALLERVTGSRNGLPVAQTILVLNEASGPFNAYGSSADFQRLTALKESHGLKITRISACHSEIWPAVERHFISFKAAVALTTDELESRFGLGPFAAAGAHAELLEWLNESLANLRAVGLIPDLAPTNSTPR